MPFFGKKKNAFDDSTRKCAWSIPTDGLNISYEGLNSFLWYFLCQLQIDKAGWPSPAEEQL